MRGNAVHLQIAAIADDDPPFRVEQKQTMRHAGDRGIETMLFERQPPPRPFVIAAHLTRHQQHDGRDRQRDQQAGAEQHLGLLPPVGQRVIRLACGGDVQREVLETVRGDDQFVWIDLSEHADRSLGIVAERIAGRGEDAADGLRSARIAHQQRAVVAVERDGSGAAEGDRAEQLLEIVELDGADDDAGELPVMRRNAAREIDRPCAVGPIAHGHADELLELRIRFEDAEVIAVDDRDAVRPLVARRVDDNAVSVHQRDGVDLRQAADLVLEHGVDVVAAETRGEFVARANSTDPVNDASVNEFDRLERAVELLGEREDGVLELAFAVGQRALAKISDEKSRADEDGEDQQRRADEQVID